MKSRTLLKGLAGFYMLVAGYVAFGQNETRLLKSTPLNKAATIAASVPGVHAKTTAATTLSRLTGAMYAQHNGAYYEPVDSYMYKYSGARGGDLMSEMLGYDNGEQFAYQPGFSNYMDDMRYTQTFDERNNILTTLYESWDAPVSGWKNNYRYVYTYDGMNNMTSNIRQNWSGSLNNWVNANQTIYSYDANGNMLTQIERYWQTSSSSWVNDTKYTFTYDANKNRLSNLYQSWNSGSNTWSNQDQTLYTFDAANNVLTQIYMTWTTSGGGSWRNQNKTAYTYNGNAPLTRLYQTWNTFGSGSWNNSNQNLYTYDTVVLTNLMKDVYQTWGGSSWSNSSQTMYTYDAANNRISETGQTWVFGFPSAWRNSYYHTSGYDSRHNLVSHLEQTWSTGSSAWVNNRQYDYTFNKYDQMTSRKSNTWNAGGFWYPTTSDYYSRYYYEEYSTGVSNVYATNGTLQLYPVPASSTLTVNLEWNTAQAAVATIYDMQGRAVAQWQLGNAAAYHSMISVAQLADGNYILRIKGEKDIMVQQFAVAH